MELLKKKGYLENFDNNCFNGFDNNIQLMKTQYQCKRPLAVALLSIELSPETTLKL